jgi:hypothetical protein
MPGARRHMHDRSGCPATAQARARPAGRPDRRLLACAGVGQTGDRVRLACALSSGGLKRRWSTGRMHGKATSSAPRSPRNDIRGRGRKVGVRGRGNDSGRSMTTTTIRSRARHATGCSREQTRLRALQSSRALQSEPDPRARTPCCMGKRLKQNQCLSARPVLLVA